MSGESQSERTARFRALHFGQRAFVIPNPWDAGTARLLAGLGFTALATTSAGYAFSRGRRDGSIGRDEMLRHATEIAAATDLPTSADLESGFGDAPEAVAETIRLAAQTRLCGVSIEDSLRGPGGLGLYDIDVAAERIRAAAEVAHGSTPLVLTARAENYLVGQPDLHDTIRRLQAYQEAGADVLYAPGLRTAHDITQVVRAVDRPVNVVMGLTGAALTLDELSSIGVKRVSVGSALARAALGAFLRAGREMREHGTFGFAADAVPFAEITALLPA
jgi:2-methylisocitrate lyase-like PEP mutase family enzyme